MKNVNIKNDHHPHELIKESYFLFSKVLNNEKGFPLNRKIHGMVQWLYDSYGLTVNDLLHTLFTIFLKKSLYLKYDSLKTKLSTFILHCTHNLLRAMVRSYTRLFKNYREVPFLNDQDEDHLSGKLGISIYKLEKSGHPGVVNSVSAEDQCTFNELISILKKNFTEIEVQVLLEEIDRRTAAEKLSMSYEAFRKHLQRKINLFKPVLADLGYC